jgi:hypothetical protein
LVSYIKERTKWGVGVFEDRMLKRMCGLEREEIAEGWRKFCYGSFIISILCHIQYYARDQIEDAVGGACGTCGREEKCMQDDETRNHMEDLGISETMIRKSTLNTMGGYGLRSSGSGPLVCCSEHGSDPSGSIKCGEFFDYLRNY